MAALKQEALSETSPDCFDMDQYINLDGPSPSISPAASINPFSAAPSTQTVASSSRHQQPLQQTFSGPSHQYEQYKQQTGLPVGALANTFALNDLDDYSYGSYGMLPPNDGYFGMNTVEPEFIDFNTLPEQTPIPDNEMDFSMTPSSFVNSSTFNAPETAPPITHPTHPGRVWPGMHQQQAAMAKAQQQAQQQALVAAQRQRSASMQSRRPDAIEERENEEVVEESISRLLDRMRNSSMTSSTGEDATAGASGLSHSARMRKDEEDMDEDERLLASEEGKKLTSKERRQLRNKVSARAFRSRRKEYIGQLEGELAAKAEEADKYRIKSEELMAENKRLTDLTRMLLSSPSFSQFLNELSGTGMSVSTLQNLTQGSSSSQPQQILPKDVNPNNHISRSHSTQPTTIGMAMIPEEPASEMDPQEVNYNGHGGNIHYGTGLYDAQVYAVPSMPLPALDTFDAGFLSGKTSSTTLTSSTSEGKDAPQPIETMPERFCQASATSMDKLDSLDTCCAADLYDDIPLLVHHAATGISENTPREPAFEGSIVEKVSPCFELVTVPAPSSADAEVDEAAMIRLKRFCLAMEEDSATIERLTAHF